MAKLTLVDFANLNNEQSVTTALNQNNAAIEAAMEITLSRDGTIPNQMDATLDMDSNRIINLPTPISNFEPVRKIDLDEATFGPPTNGNGTAGVTSIDNVAGALTTGQTLEMVGTELRTVGFTGHVTSPANTFATTIAPGVITNARMSDMNARSFKGNHLAAAGPVQDIAIINLNQNVVVDPANDWFLCHDTSTNTMQRANANQIGASGAWVTSVEGQKGVINLVAGTGISIVAGSGGITITNTGDGPGTGAVDSVGGMDGTIGLALGLEKVPGLNQIRIDEVWMKRPVGLSWYIGNAGNINTAAPASGGQNNIGIGDLALASIGSGVLNVAIGSQAGQGISHGGGNIAIGQSALDLGKSPGAGVFVLEVNPLAGQTVTIGGTTTVGSVYNIYQRVYTFKTALTANDDVLIGTTPAATLTNLRDAINHFTGGQGTRYRTISEHPLVTGTGGTTPITGIIMGIATKDPDVNPSGVVEPLDQFNLAWRQQQLLTTVLEASGGWTRPKIFGSGHVSNNVAIGSSALSKSVSGVNIGIGVNAGANITTGDSNIMMGSGAGFGLTEGLGKNVMIGYQSGYGHSTQGAVYEYCTGVGLFALQWCGYGIFNETHTPAIEIPQENTALGATAGLSITRGSNNTAIGANSMGGNFDPGNPPLTSLEIRGFQNTAVGDSSLRWVAGGVSRNTAVGYRALFSRGPAKAIPTDPEDSIVFHLTANDNVAIGYSALHTAVRLAARNIAIGSFAIGKGTKPFIPVGSPGHDPTWTHQNFLDDNFEGSGNIAIGTFAGYALRQDPPPGATHPSKNILIGDYSSSTNANLLGIVTGSNNVIIGGEIVNLGNVSNNVILATGNGATRILWWDGITLKLPFLTTPGLLAIDEDKNLISGAVGVPGGGTGIASYNQGDMIYAQADDMLVTLTKSVIATEYLSNTGTANAPRWAKIDLATGVTGQLSIAGIAATGTPNSTTFLRGDGTWAPGGGGGGGVIGPGLTTAGRMATYADTSGNILSAALVGTATTVLHGGTDGVVSFSAVNLATDVSGNLSTNNLAGGSGANSTTFWRGDGQWAAPPSGTGTGGVSGPGATFIGRMAVYNSTDGNTLGHVLGTGTQVLHGGTDGVVSFSSVNLAADVTGQLPLGHLAGGAGGDGTKFLAGDNTWKTVTASGGTGTVSADGSTIDGAITVWKNTLGTIIGDLATNPLGTTTTVLHGNAAGEPSYGAVNLVNDTIGTLPTSKGGTGTALTGVPGGIAYFSSGTTITSSGAFTDKGILLGGGSGNPPTSMNAGGLGQILISQGVTGPSWAPLGGAISMTGSTGTIVMNSGVTYPEPRFTGSVQQTNITESIRVFNHAPASGASTDGIIIGRLRFDAAISTGVSRVFGAFWCQLIDNTGNVSRLSWDVSQGGTTTKTGMTLGGTSTAVDLTIPAGDVKVTLAGKGFTTGTTGFASIGSGGITTSGKLISTSNTTTDGIGYGLGAGSLETQTGSNLSSVNISPAALCGVITTLPTQVYTLAAGASASFPVAATGIDPTDIIIVNTQLYTGAGTPVVYAGNVQANAFRIYIHNIHATVAMNDNLVINWAVIKSTSAGALLARIEEALDQPQVDPTN